LLVICAVITLAQVCRLALVNQNDDVLKKKLKAKLGFDWINLFLVYIFNVTWAASRRSKPASVFYVLPLDCIKYNEQRQLTHQNLIHYSMTKTFNKMLLLTKCVDQLLSQNPIKGGERSREEKLHHRQCTRIVTNLIKCWNGSSPFMAAHVLKMSCSSIN